MGTSRKGMARAGAICLLAGALAVSSIGCGHKFQAPVEHPKPPYIPLPATFIKVATWQQPGWNPTCVLLTRSGVLLVAEDSARVQQYAALGNAATAQKSDVFNFNGLVKPVQVASAGYDIFVADMGDTAQHVPISVYRFNYSSGVGADHPLSPVSSFVDPTWVRIKGLSADLSGNVYVSCDAHVLVQQLPNPLGDEVQSVIYRYHGQYPGAPRDTVADQGTGVGTVVDAHAVAWTRENVLYVADTGKGWAQQLQPLGHDQGNFRVDGTEGSSPDTLRLPTGVSGDDLGHFYVADPLLDLIYRYNSDGSFDQVVNQAGPDGMLAPTSVSAGSLNGRLYLYVADPVAHLINLYLFQQ